MSVQPEGPEPAAEPEMVLRDPVVAIVGGPDTRDAIRRLNVELNDRALAALRTQLLAAQERVKALEAALEPFAKFDRYVRVTGWPDGEVVAGIRSGGIISAELRVIDFAKVSDALNGK